MFENLQYGDRHPPLHHLALWLTVKGFGDGELAVRLPSLIAGTLVIPALYLLGRELFDRRTGLIAAAFVTVSPLLIWYAQEARMYAFVTLFGVLALWTQLRVIRDGAVVNWAAYILATSALLWSHYFGLLLIGVQQLMFMGVIIQRRRAGEADRALCSASPTPRRCWPCSSYRCSPSPTSSSTRPRARRWLAQRHLRRAVLLRRGGQHGLGALGLPPRRHHRAPGRPVAAAPAALAAAARPGRLAADDRARAPRRSCRSCSCSSWRCSTASCSRCATSWSPCPCCSCSSPGW